MLYPGLPWWHSGWESVCQCRGHGFEPWSGKIPHAAEQRGPWATITEPARLETVLHNKRGRDSERPAHHDEEWPPLAATRESPRTETKTQHSHKKIKKKKCYTQKNDPSKMKEKSIIKLALSNPSPSSLTWQWPKERNPCWGTVIFSDQTGLLRCVEQEDLRAEESEIFFSFLSDIRSTSYRLQ